jgi:PAS domain S-box-containing protein
MQKREISRSAGPFDEIKDLYNNAPYGLHSLDEEGVFVRVNNTELRWLGYTRDELIGKMKITDLLASNSVETAKDYFARFQSQGFVRNVEMQLVCKDGAILPVLVSAIDVRDSQGNYPMPSWRRTGMAGSFWSMYKQRRYSATHGRSCWARKLKC